MISFSEIRVRGPARFIYCAEERPLLGNFSGHKTFICPHGLMVCKLRRQMGRSISLFRLSGPPPSNTHRHARARTYSPFPPTHTHTHTHTHTLLRPERGTWCRWRLCLPYPGISVWCVNAWRPASAPGGSLSWSQRLSL